MLIDTHCHIHDADYSLDKDEVVKRAHDAGIIKIICVGSSETSSREAIAFASKHDEVFASVGVHPHYAKDGIGDLDNLISDNKIIAIGEIGLDYYYENSPRVDQMNILRQQIELALKYDLPIIFHVRNAFEDFWSILDEFKSEQIRGVIHSFSDTIENAQEAIKRGFYLGINGISTFTKDKLQKEMFATIPIEKIIFETDAPFLTPSPLRGKVKLNEPAFVRDIAEYNALIRQISFDEIANITTANARTLFYF